MGVPGADDIMLNYQSTSFHDAQYIRQTLNLKPAPEFDAWLKKTGIFDDQGRMQSLGSADTKFKLTAANLLTAGMS